MPWAGYPTTLSVGGRIGLYGDALIKNVEQQSVLMLHRTRDLLIRQRTQLINALRAHLCRAWAGGSEGA